MTAIFRTPFFIFLTLVLSNAFQSLLYSENHPYLNLGRNVFDSLKTQDFQKFFSQSVFSLTEPEFRTFLLNIRNQDIRNHLTDLHKLPFPEDANTTQKKWDIVFAHNWRKEWRHLNRNTNGMVKSESFLPLLHGAEKYSFQWQTVELLKVEVLLPLTWQNGRFELKRDFDLSEFEKDSRTIFIDRRIQYRITPNKSTYSKAFMIGTIAEDSESLIKENILGNGSGQGDIILNFPFATEAPLYYFCPDQKGVGGEIIIKDFMDYDKPNQRHDLLITMAFGNPVKYFQIQLKDVLMVGEDALFFGRPEWIGEVSLPSGILY
tara:strand:- start:4585 stop:5541 length:957 start_codon:yes stop_codon:yes gene_type:complete